MLTVSSSFSALEDDLKLNNLILLSMLKDICPVVKRNLSMTFNEIVVAIL